MGYECTDDSSIIVLQYAEVLNTTININIILYYTSIIVQLS